MAAAFGCVDFIDTHAAQLYTYASGTCTYQGQVAQVVTFRDNAGRDQWLAIGQQFGGSFVVGDRFAVTARGIDLAKAASDLQGELR